MGRLPRAGQPRRAARAARAWSTSPATRCWPGCTCSRSPTATPARCTSWPRPRSSGRRVSFDADALLRLVRARAAPAAVALHARPVRAAGLRGDAPADPGGARGAVLRGVPGALPGPGGARRRAGRRTCSPPGAGSATTAARSRCSAPRARVAEHGWPEDLTELPGVGAYTAAAVASFAWDAQVAAVDTNVRRVISPPRRRRARAPRALAARAAELMPAGRAAPFNQAMMELGATVCRPRRPRLRRLPGAARVRLGGPRAGGARARPAGASASRTPTAGRAGGSSPRWWPASRRPRSRPSAARAPRPGWCATASPSAAPMARCGCP